MSKTASICALFIVRCLWLLLVLLLVVVLMGVVGGCSAPKSEKIGTGTRINIKACTCCTCDPCMCPEKTVKSIDPGTGKVTTRVTCPCCECEVCDCATKPAPNVKG